MQFLRQIINLGSRWIVQDTTTGSGALARAEHPDVNERPISTRVGVETSAPARIHIPKPPINKGLRIDSRATLVQRQCLKLALSIFNRAHHRARSLGFTSAIAGEGKSFLASTTAVAIATQARRPVTLVDCNWEHPSAHDIFGLADSPGLAEWLRNECELSQIRRVVSPNLTVIPAGASLGGAIELTNKLTTLGIARLLVDTDEVIIADLPPVLTSASCAPLSQSLDAVTLVIRAGVTWDSYVVEARHELEDAPVEGLILNSTSSHIPRWLQRLL